MNNGCLLSIFESNSLPKSWHFPKRNRFIASIVDEVIVVEAQARSGSRFTALSALQLGKRVFVVPGTEGTNELLLKPGVLALKKMTSVVEMVNNKNLEKQLQFKLQDLPTLSILQKKIYKILVDTAPNSCELRELLIAPVSQCLHSLMVLEQLELCIRLTGDRYLALNAKLR